MNYRFLLSSAFCAMMVMSSCSSDAPDAPQTADEAAGSSYVNIAINLPTVYGSRADQSNDQFDDGDASEYNVKCAHLVIFKGTSEGNAKVEETYDLTGLKPWNPEGTTTDNVTSTAKMVQEISQTPDDDLWMLIVLNDPSASTHFTKGKTFTSLTDTPASTLDITNRANGFYMTNAPLYTGGNAATLVKLDQSAIYTTAAAAAAAPAVDVYVERGLAKVSVTTPSETQKVNVDNTDYVVELQTWGLDITNTKTFPVRNVSEFGDWKDLAAAGKTKRFYSSDSQRIYWAIDPNYDVLSTEDNNVLDQFKRNTNPTNELANPDYCLENTFNVACQNQNQTTRVVFKATFHKENESATTVYTIGTGAAIYDKENMQNVIINAALNTLDGKDNGTLYSFAETTSVSTSAGDKELKIGDISYDGTRLSQDEIDAINNAIGTIHTYKDGVCYYVARIQHFGETYTPWESGDPNYGDEPDATKNYLGRYGVVRNNWYELAVSQILTIGTATVPDPKPTPDDESHNYINFSVKMHAWAKRVQSVTL